MKKKLFSLFLFFTAFALAFSSFNVHKIYATLSASGSSDLTGVEDVEVTVGDKMILKDGTPVKDVFNSTDDLINLLVKVLFIGAGFVLFIMVIGAGFAMIQGGGKDMEKAKGTMTSAIIGFIIMFAAYWIMQIIQMLTGLNLGFK